MKKKILFDALILSKKNTGVARGVMDILEEIKGNNNIFILANKYFPFKKNEYNTIFIKYGHIPLVRIFIQLFFIPLIMIGYNFKTYISPTHILPIFKFEKYVAIMHDLMLYKVKGKYPFFKTIFYKFYYLLTLKNSDFFIVPSYSTKRDLSLYTNKKIYVMPWTIYQLKNVEETKYPIHKKYILTVGSLEKGKNLGFLIRAYGKLSKKVRDEYLLVITGKNINSAKDIKKLIEKYNLKKYIVFTGFVKDSELVYLYKHASLFVFPSLYEGFGFPVLEAVYFGTPTLCSNSSSLKEIITDRRFRFSLNDTDELGEKIEKMLYDQSFMKQWKHFRSKLSFKNELGIKNICTRENCF